MSNNTENLTLSNLMFKGLDLTESTFGIKSADIKSTNTENLTFTDLIVNELDLTANSMASNQNGYYTPADQSVYQGQFITQIGLDVIIDGKITVFFLENVNTTKGRVAFSLSLNVTKDKKWYDINKYLATTMSIAICAPNGGETPFKYISNSSKKFYYSSGSLSSWIAAGGDLNIGIKVRNTNGINHSLKNKKISIIGDSISTFFAYNSGEWGRYPILDIGSAEDTWWMQLLLQTGAKLAKNNSIGGSFVTQLVSSDTKSLQGRFKSIPIDTDICFIAMGTNDLGNGRDLPACDFSKETFDLTNFTDATCNAIINLQQNYPTTKFVWITPMKRFDGTKGEQPYTKNGQTIQTYTDRLIEICDFYGWEYVNMTNLGINYINQSKYFADGLHPNKAGMYLMADYIKNSFK